MIVKQAVLPEIFERSLSLDRKSENNSRVITLFEHMAMRLDEIAANTKSYGGHTAIAGIARPKPEKKDAKTKIAARRQKKAANIGMLNSGTKSSEKQTALARKVSGLELAAKQTQAIQEKLKKSSAQKNNNKEEQSKKNLHQNAQETLSANANRLAKEKKSAGKCR